MKEMTLIEAYNKIAGSRKIKAECEYFSTSAIDDTGAVIARRKNGGSVTLFVDFSTGHVILNYWIVGEPENGFECDTMTGSELVGEFNDLFERVKGGRTW